VDQHSGTLLKANHAASAAPAVKENWWAEVRAVFFKDVRSELRTKSALGTILMFSFATMMLISMLVQTRGLGLTTEGLTSPTAIIAAVLRGEPIYRTVPTLARASLIASLYWIVLFFSAMAGLSRVFVKEEEMKTAPVLRLMARPSAVYTGKLLFNVALLQVLTLLLVPLFFLFLEPKVNSWPQLLACFSVGALGLASASTILGAIVARANNRGYLMVLLGFGPLLPILTFGIKGTIAALHGNGGNNLVPLVSYVVVMTLLSAFLFPKVWSD
jgi:heme exporter protein B